MFVLLSFNLSEIIPIDERTMTWMMILGDYNSIGVIC